MCNCFTYRYKYCQSQNGSADCGLFAIAFASVIAKREDPSCYNFNQQTMRDHLHQCLSNGVFTDFPVKGQAGRMTKSATLFMCQFTVTVGCQKLVGLRW